MTHDKTPLPIKLDSKQHPSDTFRQSFTEVVMGSVLREQLKIINDWLEDDQVEEVVLSCVLRISRRKRRRPG